MASPSIRGKLRATVILGIALAHQSSVGRQAAEVNRRPRGPGASRARRRPRYRRSVYLQSEAVSASTQVPLTQLANVSQVVAEEFAVHDCPSVRTVGQVPGVEDIPPSGDSVVVAPLQLPTRQNFVS